MSQYHQITIMERKELERLLYLGYGEGAIALKLNRSRSTIYRELRRNRFPDSIYNSVVATGLSWSRRSRRLRVLKSSCGRWMSWIIQYLRRGWSPDAISGRMGRLRLPFRVSHEWIYQYIYRNRTLGGNLWRYLYSHRPRRHAWHRGKAAPGIVGRVGIEERPAAVENRRVLGHWEGDRIVGSSSSAGLVTLAERKSRFLMAGVLKNGKAATLNRRVKKLMARVLAKRWKTLTVDNGREFARHRKLPIPVYFCDPHAPWQKGTNENTNRWLRKYFPRNLNFKSLTQKVVDHVVRLINQKPRKSLNYLTPEEVFLLG